MTARKILTDMGIRAARARAKKTGRAVWVADGAVPRSHGGLQLYVHPNGTPRWYWRYSKPDGATARVAIGTYSADKTAGAFTLTQAREEVGRMAALYRDPASRDVRAHLKRQAAHEAAEQEAAERARQAASAAEAAAGKFTLARLLDAYIAHLRKQGKQSAGDAANLFANHVAKAHPATAALPANVITARDVVAVLRALTEAGKGRTAAKLRSYLRAAYALGAGALDDPDAPAAFMPFGIQSNPVAATSSLARYNRALERALTEPELRAYWAALQAAPDSPARDALLLALLLGGQRPAQMVRATVADVDLYAKTLRLRDPKGKRTQPRLHTLPLPAPALPIFERCLARAARQKSVWLFSTHGGAPLQPATITHAAGAIAAALITKSDAERTVREPFQLRDIRRTCETRLAAMGISKDVRAQLQSHGLGGVQGRHYDKHDYLAEKAAALDAWAKLLETAPVENVPYIGERRARRGHR